MFYIYIFEDGTIKKFKLAPTKDDIGAVADGILYILRVNGNMLFELDIYAQWAELIEGS